MSELAKHFATKAEMTSGTLVFKVITCKMATTLLETSGSTQKEILAPKLSSVRSFWNYNNYSAWNRKKNL